MDASEQFAFPTPQPQDTAEVREAIEKAGILWSEDPKESLKWLRQAAELASDAGEDLRSVQLARVAADLRNLANIAPSVPPPTTLPPLSIPVPAAPTVVGEAVEGEVPPAGPVQSDPVIAVTALSEQPVDAAAVTATVDESNGANVAAAESAAEATAETEAASEAAASEQATPHVPEVAAAEQAAVSPAAEAPFGIPQVSFSKDPAQTVPATPAASAAALALAAGPASYQSVPAPASSAPGASAVASAPAPAAAPASNGSIASALTAKRQAPAFGSPSAGFGAGVGGGLAGVTGPRPEQPTLVGRPLNGPRGLNDPTPAATPAAIQADSVAPGSTNRFIQHRAVEVAISIAPNATGHFDVRPLSEGEAVEPGFRRALLVALGAEDRLFPGRG
jgi:hypothetical protein